MIYADLNGKGHVAEDLLTSNCLGLLNLLPVSDLFAFLAKARTSYGTPFRLEFSSRAKSVLDFWPYLPGGGVPDVMLTITTPGSESFKLIIEVKHGAKQS